MSRPRSHFTMEASKVLRRRKLSDQPCAISFPSKSPSRSSDEEDTNEVIGTLHHGQKARRGATCRFAEKSGGWLGTSFERNRHIRGRLHEISRKLRPFTRSHRVFKARHLIHRGYRLHVEAIFSNASSYYRNFVVERNFLGTCIHCPHR